ncbi:hypothetical protein K8Q98_01895 [Candidatus Nomurabacteria bacterium]|nr:hypothetical protein [Candidatus Nomurabacteria bacterium]
MEKRPLIIILSGTYGSGKTMLAHQLATDLRIMQRTSLSSIIRTIKTVLPENPILKNWYIRDNTEKEFLRGKITKEAELIGKIVHTITKSAEHTGENYIIDGAQLLPKFLPMDRVIFFRVFVSDKDKHKIMLSQPNITRFRRVTDISYDLSKKVEDIIENECAGHPVYHIDNVGTPEEASKKMIEMIKANYPDYADRYFWFEK